MNREEQFGRQICRLLDQGAGDLDPTVAERLRAARERALQRQPVVVAQPTIVGAGGTASLGHNIDGSHPLRTLVAILGLLLGVFFAYYWNGFQQAMENEEIDTALLADELPPNAYLDRGFQAWLEKDSPSGQ